MFRRRCHEIAEQAGGSDFTRPGEGRDGEAQCRQGAERGGKRERAGIHRVMRRRGNVAAEEMLDRKGKRRADGKPQHKAEPGHRHDLQQIWKLRRVLGALEGGSGLELLIDKLRSTKSNKEFLTEIAKAPTGMGT